MDMNNAPRREETVKEASDRTFSMWKRNMLWTALIVAAFIAYTLLRPSAGTVELGKEELTITYHDKSVSTVRYDAIGSVELLKDADYGAPLEGALQAGGAWSGRWHADAWGDYMLFIHPETDEAIALRTDKNLYVISGKTDEETELWYESLEALTP